MRREIFGPQFPVVHAQDAEFVFPEITALGLGRLVDRVEVIGKLRRHHDFPHVVEQSRHVHHLGHFVAGEAGELAGDHRRSQAVLPEPAPVETAGAGEFLEVIDHRRGHGELPDPADADVQDRLLHRPHLAAQ